MKKVVRKIKKVNIKFLFATLLIAIIAISGGIALRGGKETAAAQYKNKEMLAGAGLNLASNPAEYGISSGTNTSTSCSMDKNNYATLKGCMLYANDTATQRTVQVTLNVKETGYNGIERTINTVVYTVTIKPNTFNVNWNLSLGTKVNFLERLKKEGYINKASITSSCPTSTNTAVLPLYFNQSEGYGRCSYEAKSNGIASITFKTESKTIIVKATVGNGGSVPSASYVQRSVMFYTNVSNAQINGHFGSKNISASQKYTGFYSSTAAITLPQVTPNSQYRFVGWVQGTDCTKATYMIQIPAGSNGVTMTACLTKIESNVPSGNPGGGGTSSKQSIRVQFDAAYTDGTSLICNGTDVNSHAMVCAHDTKVGEPVRVPVAPTKSGYQFLGWSPVDNASNCANNLAATSSSEYVTARVGATYLTACFAPVSNSTLRQDACSPDFRTGVTGSGQIQHCIKTVCRNGVVVADQANASNVTCAPGYEKVTSTTAIGGTCSSELGKSCTGNGTGVCTQVWSYSCISKASLKFEKTSITMTQGARENLFDYLKFKGVNLGDIKFSYAKSSSGNDIISLSSDGTVTARNVGRITVYAKAAGSEATIDIIVGSGRQTCFNSLTDNEDHEEGDSGVVRHCMQGVCSQYGGYNFNTTAKSNYVINCVSGNKVSILKTDTCESVKGTCSPGDKVQCYQEWAWQCMPSVNAKYYTVTYNYLNDAGDVQTVKVASGDLAPEIYATRNNYTFEGWYLNGKKFDFTTPISQDLVLNAFWTCNGSNCNDGEDTPNVSKKDAPTCTLSVNKDGWATNKTLTVNVSLGKNKLAENYIEYSKDNKTQSGWGNIPYYNITENGTYTVRIRDEKGLESTCKLEETRIDRTKPTVDGNWIQGETMQISLRGVDDQSGVVKYYLSADPKDAPHQESSKWGTTSTFTLTEFGVYYAWVMDGAGNISNRIAIEDTKDITYAPDAVLTGLSAQAEGGVVETSLNQAEAMAFGLQRNYHVKQLANADNLIAFSFSPNKLKYELTVRSSKISLYATLPKGSSFVEGFEPKENQELEYGSNTIFIKVKDSKGHIRVYTILVNRPDDRSGVNLLTDLTVSGASFTFSPYKSEYTVKVPKNTTTVDINGTLADPTSTYVEGFQPREITLDGDTTDVMIKVQSLSGSVRPYILHIVKEGTTSSNPSPSTKGSNYLSSLSIVGANFTFDKTVLDYNVSVTYDVESVDIYAFAEDKSANVSIHGGGSLRVGENTATVTVTNTSGRSRTYTIKIIRKEDELGISSNTELSTLSVGGYDIKFKPNKLDYELKIDKEKTLVIMATPKSDRSNVYIVGNEDLSTFSTLKISVVAEDGSTSVYSIDISKDAWNTRIEIIIAAIGLTIAVGATVVIQVRRKKRKKALNQD